MSYQRTRALLVLFGGFLAVVSAGAVHAAVIEEIVVTAQKREQNLQKVPISISAFTGETIDKLGVDQVRALEDLTPGLTFNSQQGRTTPYLRGVGTQAVSPGNEVPIAVYYDGVYNSSNQSSTYFEFYDIERIEVLKGPQGTLFGRNATGGAINIITRTPNEQTEGQFEVSYGRFEAMEVRGYLSGAISGDAGLYGSIAAIHKESDGYYDSIRDNGMSDEDYGKDVDAARIKLLWEANDSVTLTLIADYVDAEDGIANIFQPMNNTSTLAEGLEALGLGAPGSGLVSRDPYDFSGDFVAQEMETWGVSLTVDWATEFADIKYIFGYREADNHTQLDVDGAPSRTLFANVQQGNETSTHELQFTSVGDGGFQWVAGLYYYDDDAFNGGDDYPGIHNAGITLQLGTPANPTPAELAAGGTFLNDSDGRTAESGAVYGEGTWDLTDRTRLTAGLRYTDEEIEHYDRGRSLVLPDATLTGFTLIPLSSFPDVSDSTDETTWSLVLDHHFSDDVMVYGSYKRGFKTGTYDVGVADSDTPTEPEILDAYEIGVKSTLLDSTLRLNGSVFFYDYDNLQVQILNASNSVENLNAASAEITGAEMNLEWLPTDNLAVTFNVVLLDAEYKEFKDSPITIPSPIGLGYSTGSADLSGEPLPRAPDYVANLGLNYFVPLDDNGSLTLFINWYYTDDVILDHIEEFKVHSYDRLTASLTWDSPGDRYYVKLWGKNLTDEDIPMSNSGIAFGYLGRYLPPATYGISAGVRFGQ